MSERLCNLFEECESPEAPLCPIQESTVKRGIWYPDEPICQAKMFQETSWIKKQHQIASLKLKTDVGFFTKRMLEALHIVTKNLKGANPDYPDAESKWFAERSEKKVSVVAKKENQKRAKNNNCKEMIAAPLFESLHSNPANPGKRNMAAVAVRNENSKRSKITDQKAKNRNIKKRKPPIKK